MILLGGVTRRSSFSKKRRFRKVVFPQLEGPTTKMLEGDLNVKPCSTQLMIQMKHACFIQKLLFRSLQYLPRCLLLCHRCLQDHAQKITRETLPYFYLSLYTSNTREHSLHNWLFWSTVWVHRFCAHTTIYWATLWKVSNVRNAKNKVNSWNVPL